MTKRILVSLATYQERDNLEPLICEIHQTVPQVDILVTDDYSPDGTGELADQLAAQDPRIHVIHRAGKLGLGTAVLSAMRFAMDQGYDFLIIMDADRSHSPRYLPAIIQGGEKYDVMIGSRYIPGGGTVNWTWQRKLSSWGVNGLTRLLMRIPAHDTSGAYRGYRVSFLKTANLEHLLSRGYSFMEEVLYRLRKAGAKIGETPIIFENRGAGTSKVDIKEMIHSLGILIWIGLQSTFGWDD